MRATIDTDTLDDIAEAIQTKTGSAATMRPSEMASKILAIPRGVPIMEQYEVIADTAMNNGEQTKNWLAGLIQEHTDSFPVVLAYLVYVGTNPVNRQLVASEWLANTNPVTYPDATLPTPYRWQSNAFYKTNPSGVYDTNVNVGDKYILILFKAELFDL